MSFGRIKEFVRYLVSSIIKHKIMTLSAVIAFFGFSSMIPLILLLLYGAQIVIPHAFVAQFLIEVLKSYVPTIPGAQTFLTQNISRLADLGPKVGMFGLLSLLWTTVGGFVSFQQILDMIWEGHRERSFIFQYLVGFGMLLILLCLIVVSSLATLLLPPLIKVFMGQYELAWLDIIHDISRASFLLLLFVTCYVCYRFLPSYMIRNSFLLLGALISTLAIYASRAAFIWYSRHLARYELIYGSLTFIMLFVFWVYIVSTIVLFGAEVVVALKMVGSGSSHNHDKKT